MRIYLSGVQAEVLVIGEPFLIEGSAERFAVHRTFGDEQVLWYGPWTATHAETGFRVGAGETLEEAIQSARQNWASRSPEELANALQAARLIRSNRTAEGREVLQ